MKYLLSSQLLGTNAHRHMLSGTDKKNAKVAMLAL
jgi:hypothetical protein